MTFLETDSWLKYLRSLSLVERNDPEAERTDQGAGRIISSPASAIVMTAALKAMLHPAVIVTSSASISLSWP